jgi:hypothetical protein
MSSGGTFVDDMTYKVLFAKVCILQFEHCLLWLDLGLEQFISLVKDMALTGIFNTEVTKTITSNKQSPVKNGARGSHPKSTYT